MSGLKTYPTKFDESTQRRIVIAYKRYRSLRKVAELFNAHHLTIRNVLRLHGVDTVSGNNRVDRGIIANYLRTNPDKILPRSLSQMAEIIGTTPNNIASYLYRRRKAVKKKLKELGFPEKVHGIPMEREDRNGELVRFDDFIDSKIKIENYTFKVLIELIPEKGKKKVVEYDSPEEAYEDIEVELCEEE